MIHLLYLLEIYMWLSCQLYVVLVSVNTLIDKRKCERETFLNASYTEVMVYFAFLCTP